MPVEFFTSGFHAAHHTVTDSPNKVDADKGARIFKRRYHLTRDADDRPGQLHWTPASYRRAVAAAYQGYGAGVGPAEVTRCAQACSLSRNNRLAGRFAD